MSLRFIYGRAGSGKSHYCFQDIKSKIEGEDKNPLILLVPEDYSFRAEKELLSSVGERGLIKARVLSFKRMAHAVFSETGGLTRKYINSAGKCMLLYRIMEEYKDSLKVFGKSAKLPGFINTISDMITELKIYGATPEKVGEAAEAVEGDEVLKGKLSDIGLIYSRFEEALSTGYIDPEDDLTILAGQIDKCSIFDNAEIWMDGFSVLTPQQYMVLGKLFNKAKRVNITLNSDCPGDFRDDKSGVFLGIRGMEERIIRIAAENNISFEKPIELRCSVPYKFMDNPELAHLEKNLYASPYKIYEDRTENISIFAAVNRYTEVENTARDIIRLCRDENYRFSDIAVVSKDVEGYEKLVGAVFSEYGIPYFMDRKRDINGSPLVILVMSAIEILSKNWAYEPVFRYLKTSLAGIDREDVDLIENYILAAGIKGKRWTEDREWAYWPDSGFNGELTENSKERLKRINEIRGRIIRPLMNLKSAVQDDKNVEDVCRAIFDFLCSIGVPESIEELVDKFRSSGELGLASEYSRVWNILIETLDQIVEALGDEKMSLEQFARVLSIGFGEYKIGLIPPSLDQVMFGSVERVKSQAVKALYIIGVNDGIFPSPAPEEGILSDEDREFLKDLGLELAPGSRDKIFDEQYLVYTVFTRPSKYLKISYPIADHEGKSMRYSRVIPKLHSIFKNIREYSNITEDNTDEGSLSLINAPVPAFNELVCSFRKSADGQAISPLWNDVYKWFMDKEAWRGKCKKAMAGISYSNSASPISQGRIRSLYGKNLRLSISRLERFAQCPFSYFMQYGLGANERKVYEFSPPDLGSFIHTILDGFSKYLDDNHLSWRDIEKDKCEEIVTSLVDSTVEGMSGYILSSSARYRYLKERLKRIIFRAVWLIAIHIKRGGFEPSGYEASFENGGKYPPISIELPSGEKLNLIGRIDRVDTLETEDEVYVRIVDYKSGNKSFNLSDIYNGLELQLLIYLDAILNYASQNSKKHVIPGGILYFRIDDPIIRADGELSEEEIENEIMKSLRMKGLLLSDVKVVREMDKNMDGYSVIIPANIKMGSESFGPWSSVAGEDEFKALRSHVKDIIIKLCEEMLSGNISISPYKKKKETPCKFCSYKPVCRFDVTIKENSYRIIGDKNRDEIWEAVKQAAITKGGEA